MGRFEETVHIRKSLPCELFLLGYGILQMAQKKWDPERMTAAIKATRNKEMGTKRPEFSVYHKQR
jgi:hypothetical protein